MGVINLTIQLTDNYMFWYRYMAVVPKVSFLQKVAVHAWVGLVMCPWVITNFPMPLFLDVNDKYYMGIDYVLNVIYAFGQIAFNLYFSYEFGLILYNLAYDPECKYSRAAGVVAIKTLLHCVISSIGCLLITYVPMVWRYSLNIHMLRCKSVPREYTIKIFAI